MYLHQNGLADIISYAKVKDRQNITYDKVRKTFTIHTPYKQIHFQRSKREIYYHNFKPNGKKRDIIFVHSVQENKEGFTNQEIQDTEKARSTYNIVGRPLAADFERMVRGKMLENI